MINYMRWFAFIFLYPFLSGVVALNKLPVHIFSFHRSTKIALMDWYNYHSYLFGPDHIHGIDHNSTDQEIIQVLRQKGVNITSIPSSIPFNKKKDILSSHMREISRNSEGPVFFVPLDIDEYLVALEIGPQGQISYSTNRTKILKAFHQAPRDGYKLKLRELTASFCGDQNGTADMRSAAKRSVHFLDGNPAYTYCFQKSFYHSKGFVSTDQGNHIGHVKRDSECSKEKAPLVFHGTCLNLKKSPMCFHINTGLAILHFGTTRALTYEEYTRKALHTASMYSMDIAHKHNESDCKNQGNHYCKFLVRQKLIGDAAMRAEIERNKQCKPANFNDALRVQLHNLERYNLTLV